MSAVRVPGTRPVGWDDPAIATTTAPEPVARRAPHDIVEVRARWATRVALAGMVFGAAVRVEELGSRRSLWVDEALVAHNVITRDFAGLLRPLSGEQGAPIGWLWAERAAVIALGNNEYALRAVPLLAGLVALGVVFLVGRRAVGPLAAAVATWLLALSPAAVRYSVEVKQYSSDLAVSLVVTLLALRVAQDRKGLARWGGFAAAAVWCAHPAVLVAATTAAVLGVDALRRRDGAALRRLVLASVPWLASFGAVWVVSLRRLGHDAFLRSYWAAGLAPQPLAVATWIRWLPRALLHLVADPGNMPLSLVAAACIIGGLAVATIRRPVAGALLVAPLAGAIIAATVGGFPLRGRLALWLLPVAFFGLAALATMLFPVSTARRGLAAAALVALVGGLVASPAATVVTLTRDPTIWSDIRPLLDAVHRRWQPGDQLWVHEPDAPPADYYAIAVGVAATAVLRTSAPPAPCPGDPDLVRAAAGRRVWMVYGYRLSTAVPGERAAIVGALSARARLVETLSRPQATAWLFDFGAPPSAAPPAGDHPGLPCLALTPAAPPTPTGLSRDPLGSGGPT